MTSPHSSVLITGASTGIGYACALRMDALGWRVFAGVRNAGDARRLATAASKKLAPVRLDVTNPVMIGRAVRKIRKELGTSTLSALINNAGVAGGGPAEFIPVEEYRRIMETNYLGAIAVTQAFMPQIRASHGRIVNISSLSGRVATPFLSPYSASKFALEAWSDVLRSEVASFGVEVVLVEPGPILTPIWNKAAAQRQRVIEALPAEAMTLYGELLAGFMQGLSPHGVPVGRVADSVVHALTASRPKTRYVVGVNEWLVNLVRILPDRLRDSIFRIRVSRGR